MSLVFSPPAVLLAIAIAALAVLWDGGYSSASRVAFGVLAVVAGLLLGRWRSAVVVLLVALAGLGALSALWTLGPVERTLRWSLVTLGYAAVAALACEGARRRGGLSTLALGVALLALVAGLGGLVAAVTFSPPWALRIGGVWRPAGPFEYPPALALLMASALPAFLWAMCGRSRVLAACGAPGMAVTGGALALSASRVELAVAVAVGGIELALAGRRPAADSPAALVPPPGRAHVAAALALGVAAGIALQVAAGAPAAGGEPDGGRIAALLAVLALAVPGWLAARRRLDRRDEPGAAPAGAVGPAGTSPAAPATGGSANAAPAQPRAAATFAAVALAALLVGSLAFGAQAGRGAGAAAGFLHGREHTWRAALETFADRPAAGAGADAFLAGSARHQKGETVVFAHSLPLELAAELGAAGLVLAIALYAASVRLLYKTRATPAGRLLGPAAAAFLVASLVDWPWHLAGAGAIWAIGLGALAGASARPWKVARQSPLGDR